jgi:hypothetical protein
MRPNRAQLRRQSNNSVNPNKNICVLACAKFLKVDENVRYFHYLKDLVRAARMNYTVRSRKSTLATATVGGSRKLIKSKGDAKFYIVRIHRHVLLLDSKGNTIVDTDPRKRDCRKLTHIYGVYSK